MGDWSNLPQQLVLEISKRLSINEDYIRYHAVCGSWRSSLLESSPHHLPCQLPWLMLPYKDDETSTLRGFFDLSNSKICWLELPEAIGKRSCGSSQGWLVLVEESPAISLLNPLTRVQIQLPPITTFPDMLDFRISEVGEEYLHRDLEGYIVTSSLKEVAYIYMNKVILSKNPTHNEGYTAMAIYGDVIKLAFCRSGDDKWTVIKDKERTAFSDIIYYNEQFYAVDCQGRVVVCDIDTDPSSPKIITITPDKNLFCDYDKKLLVESAGELLLVYRHRIFPDGDGEEDYTYETVFFKVFKLNHEEREWVEVKSLGDRTLFLGDNCSLSLCAKDFPGCKANCIYFSDDDNLGGNTDSGGRGGGHDVGIFNMENQSIEPFPFYIDRSKVFFYRPIWVTPSLY